MFQIGTVGENLFVEVVGLIAVEVGDLDTVGQCVTVLLLEEVVSLGRVDSGHQGVVVTGPVLEAKQDDVGAAAICAEEAAGIEELLEDLVVRGELHVVWSFELVCPKPEGGFQGLRRERGTDAQARRGLAVQQFMIRTVVQVLVFDTKKLDEKLARVVVHPDIPGYVLGVMRCPIAERVGPAGDSWRTMYSDDPNACEDVALAAISVGSGEQLYESVQNCGVKIACRFVA